MDKSGQVQTHVADGIGRIVFSHPKANCLPRASLTQIAQAIDELSNQDQVRVMLLSSAGSGAFSAGASFEEFQQIDSEQAAEHFFLGFSEVLHAMQASKKFIVGRVQGKAVGGGVGLIAGCDYVYATKDAAVKLSEIELGIGPFVVGPAVERRIGNGSFAALCLDGDWRDASWCERHGLFQQVVADIAALDVVVETQLQRLSKLDANQAFSIRKMLWAGTEQWQKLLPERAKISGHLLQANGRQFKKS